VRVQQRGSLGQQSVETLLGDVDRRGVAVSRKLHGVARVRRVLPECREEVTTAPFGEVDAFHEPQSGADIRVAGQCQVAQCRGARPLLRELPAVQQEHGDRIEGDPPLGRGPAQQLRQHRAQGCEVHES